MLSSLHEQGAVKNVRSFSPYLFCRIRRVAPGSGGAADHKCYHPDFEFFHQRSWQIASRMRDLNPSSIVRATLDDAITFTYLRDLVRWDPQMTSRIVSLFYWRDFSWPVRSVFGVCVSCTRWLTDCIMRLNVQEFLIGTWIKHFIFEENSPY